jgi:hypothetical protein
MLIRHLFNQKKHSAGIFFLGKDGRLGKKKKKEAIQYTVYDCPFGIFKLFFVEYHIPITLKVY